jgi:hypothetical protein
MAWFCPFLFFYIENFYIMAFYLRAFYLRAFYSEAFYLKKILSFTTPKPSAQNTEGFNASKGSGGEEPCQRALNN